MLVTSPAGVVVSFQVFANDIHLSIDPGTGEVVSGRQATVAVLQNELIDANMQGIRGISDSSQKPWQVAINDINGIPYTFKVVETYPDNGMGLTVLFLEGYKPA